MRISSCIFSVGSGTEKDAERRRKRSLSPEPDAPVPELPGASESHSDTEMRKVVFYMFCGRSYIFIAIRSVTFVPYLLLSWDLCLHIRSLIYCLLRLYPPWAGCFSGTTGSLSAVQKFSTSRFSAWRDQRLCGAGP